MYVQLYTEFIFSSWWLMYFWLVGGAASIPAGKLGIFDTILQMFIQYLKKAKH